MNNQPTSNSARTIHPAKLLGAFPEIDDDENDAVWSDDEDDDTVAPPQSRWFSRAGFGSPEWWTL